MYFAAVWDKFASYFRDPRLRYALTAILPEFIYVLTVFI